MNYGSHRRLTILAALLVIAAACGGDDSAATTEAPVTHGTSATTVTPGDSGGAFTSGSIAEVCGRLFSLAEVEALFEQPAELDEELSDGYTESLGSIVCSWTTIENPDDLTDLAAETLVAQVYLGDPIDGANFYAPDQTYEQVTHIDGIGDDAFAGGSLGMSTGFLDGPIAGFVSYADIDLGGGDNSASQESVLDMLRLLHDRAS